MFNKIRVKIKCFIRKYKLMNQFCKKCGKPMTVYDYSVSDDVWEKMPLEYQNHVLCLDCFISEYLEKYSECHHEIEVKLFFL